VVQGKGRCEIRGNMLYLNFEKASELKDSAKLPEIAMSDNKNGNYVLNIQCVNFHADPIGFGAVQITRSNGTTVMLLGDIAGRMSYKINSADLPIQVETKMIAGKTETFKIDNLSDYQVRIFHDDSLFIERLNQGEIWSYEIDELSEDVIVMKPAKTSGEYRRYTKKYNK
jgi:hypothetical protein